MAKEELMTYINDLSDKAFSEATFIGSTVNMKKLSLRDKLIFKAGEASGVIEVLGDIQEKINGLLDDYEGRVESCNAVIREDRGMD